MWRTRSTRTDCAEGGDRPAATGRVTQNQDGSFMSPVWLCFSEGEKTLTMFVKYHMADRKSVV